MLCLYSLDWHSVVRACGLPISVGVAKARFKVLYTAAVREGNPAPTTRDLMQLLKDKALTRQLQQAKQQEAKQHTRWPRRGETNDKHKNNNE